VVIRTLLAIVATALLAIPLVKILGALALLIIAMNLVAGDELGEDAHGGAEAGQGLWAAAAIILVADTAMSLDNVVALAAIARGNYLWLAAGVALSLPIIAFGGVMLSGLLQRAPWLVEIGAALLGWIALGMATSDPILGGWADAQAPGLSALAPALGGAFVFLYGRWVANAPGEKREPRPATRAPRFEAPRPVPAPPAPRSAPPVVAPQVLDLDPEPDDQYEAPRAPASRDDRAAIIGVILLALVAGAILMVVSFLDSFN
jgi:YjbE family integral membrane protein